MNGRRPPAQMPPSNIVGRITITAYADRPVGVNCTLSAAGGLLLMARAIDGLTQLANIDPKTQRGLGLIAQLIGLMAQQMEEVAVPPPSGPTPPPEKKEFRYAGPRESINYGPDVGKNKPDEKLFLTTYSYRYMRISYGSI